MIHCIRTNSYDSHFKSLVKELDADLAIRDGDEHAFYAQFNKIQSIRHVIVAYHKDIAVGCGAIKVYNSDSLEIKRMYVLEAYRGKGIASSILQYLEKWAVELNY